MKNVVVLWTSANAYAPIAGNLQVVSAAWGTLLPADKARSALVFFP